MADGLEKPEGMTWEEWVALRNQQSRDEDGAVVTGSAIPSDDTPIKVKQPVGMAPGGYNYRPYVEYEIYEEPAKNLVDLNNSQSWLSRVLDTEKGYDSLVQALQGVGAISSDNPTWGTVATAARQVLSSAGSRGQEFWSFVNDRTVQDPQDTGPGGGTGSGRAPRMPSRNEVVQESNEMDANVLLNNAMQQSVGRDATEAEVQAFTRILNGEAEANPQFSQSNPVGMNDTKQRTGGGINRELLAAEFADGTPGAPEYKMATEGMEALEGWFAQKIGVF